LKVNPPIRSCAEKNELQNHLFKNNIDCFATDHAPHLKEEKQLLDYNKVPSGIPAVEFFWPLVYKLSTLTNSANLEKLSATATINPAKLFNFKNIGSIKKGYSADFVWLKRKKNSSSKETIIAKCGWSPYQDFNFTHQVQQTWKNGSRVYRRLE
jgi:dihydroorotase